MPRPDLSVLRLDLFGQSEMKKDALRCHTEAGVLLFLPCSGVGRLSRVIWVNTVCTYLCLYIVFKKFFIKWLFLLNILLTHECTCKCDQSKKVELGLTKDVTEDSTFAKLILFIRLTFYVGGKYSRKKQITKFFSATATKGYSVCAHFVVSNTRDFKGIIWPLNLRFSQSAKMHLMVCTFVLFCTRPVRSV